VPDDDEDDEDTPKSAEESKPKAQKRYGTGLSWISGVVESRGAEVTLRIDSNLLAAAENEDPNATRKEAADELRKHRLERGQAGRARANISAVWSASTCSARAGTPTT
jgi:type III restriction enzyme